MWKLLLALAAIVAAVVGVPPLPAHHRPLPAYRLLLVHSRPVHKHRPLEVHRPLYKHRPLYSHLPKHSHHPQPLPLPLPLPLPHKSHPWHHVPKQTCPMTCTLDWKPVCGRSHLYGHKTFGNKCHFMEYARCTDPNGVWSLVSSGECPSNTSYSYEDRVGEIGDAPIVKEEKTSTEPESTASEPAAPVIAVEVLPLPADVEPSATPPEVAAESEPETSPATGAALRQGSSSESLESSSEEE